MTQCDHCGNDDADFQCQGCMKIHYCSPECQRAAWRGHKADCKKAREGIDSPSSRKKDLLSSASQKHEGYNGKALPKAPASAISPTRPAKTIDYSKFDKIVDSDDEKEIQPGQLLPSDGTTQGIPVSHTTTILGRPQHMVSLAEFTATWLAFCERAKPRALAPDTEAMFREFQQCTDTTERALVDQACFLLEGHPLPSSTSEAEWRANTRQLTMAMIGRGRCDEVRMWCAIRALRFSDDPEPYYEHAIALEEQCNKLQMKSSEKVFIPSPSGRKEVPIKEAVKVFSEACQAHLNCAIKVMPKHAAARAGLVASLEKAGKIAEARRLGKEGVECGTWTNECQRPSHFMPTLTAKPFHPAVEFLLCDALEKSHYQICAEFDSYLVGGGKLAEVGLRSGETMLCESGLWHELPLFHSSRMDSEICGHFPETTKILTQVGAEATGLAFCGGGEVAFRTMGPGTRLKPHCGPTNARLACHLALKVPSTGTLRLRVGDAEPQQWEEGRCIVFDDSFEHEERWEADENDESELVILLLHFWHPEFPYKNDPEWRQKTEAGPALTAPPTMAQQGFSGGLDGLDDDLPPLEDELDYEVD